VVRPLSHRPLRTRSVAVIGSVVLLVAVVLAVVAARQGPDCGLGDDAARTRPSFGVTVAGFPADDSELRRLASGLQRRPDVVMWYDAWSSGTDFPADAAARVRRLGAVPEITWEPWDPAAGPDQQTYPLPGIAAGDQDEYLARWAGQVAGYGFPVRLRFAHEMNADTYPWSEVDGRNPRGSYVAAWRHVRDVFDDAGADNVTWVWSPNTPYDGTTPLEDLYPGDEQVEAVALDGYNWSTVRPDLGWQSFEETFGPGIGELAALTDRPLFIGEVASAEQGGDKAAWVRDMFDTMRSADEVCGFTWFDIAKETDWRIDSSPASHEAFRAELGDR